MILDEFELLKKLGEGAFATVWAARRVDAPPNASGDRARKLYAVKHLKAATDPATGQDLLTTAEFRSLRAIPRHPNVLRPVQVARERGQVFLVTEWCESDVLKTLEAAKARGEIGLPESSVAGVGRGLLRALAHCHAHGWAHRDVKPENILIADGAVRLADFGEAAETSAESGDDVSLRETYVGTRWYRAPEQFLPRGVWEKAPGNAHARDVWAAGCVMGECLLGRALFRGAGAGDMLRKIAELVGEDASAPTPRSVRDAWADAAGGDCLPRGPGRFEETFNVQRSTGHCVSNGSGVSNECLALLREMLRVDPARRITAARAAEHPFFASAPRRASRRSRRDGPPVVPPPEFPVRSPTRAAERRRRLEPPRSGVSARSRTPRAMTSSTSTRATPAASAPAPRARRRARRSTPPSRLSRRPRRAPRWRRSARAWLRGPTETGTEPPPPGIEPPPPSKEADDAAPRVAASLRAARLDDSSSSDDEFDHAPAPTVSAATGGSARAREDAFSDDAVMR